MRAAQLERDFTDASPAEIVAAVAGGQMVGRIALVSSFGADAAVMLHLVSVAAPDTPVLFIDTLRHFPETLAYRDQMVARLGLTDVRSVTPPATEVARRDPDLSLAGSDPDACCGFRKAAPLDAALSGFDAWLTGRRRAQAATRAALAVFDSDGRHIKVNPLARLTDDDIDAYVWLHGLPRHPLVAQGYRSIGCAPCTANQAGLANPRDGRWQGAGKTECGIHRPSPSQTTAPS